jgi:uncharacterized glyoxalase superfamily protein PhnB
MSDPTHHPMCVMLTCKDAKKSIAFYRGVLGFELEKSWPDDDNPMWANLLLDGQSVMVGQAQEPDAAMCAHGSPEQVAYWKERWSFWSKNDAGSGMLVYLMVPDVDGYYKTVKSKGAEPRTPPISQFYGIRDFVVADPSGYQLVFYSAIKMENCQSCGMPLADAKPGQMYCGHCTDEKGNLHPYEAILEGTIQGYFMGMQKMSREDAEPAAREHLAKMPAWQGRG